MLLLYSTLTEMDSDFNGQDINFYTKTIVTYSWLNKDVVPWFLKELEELNILKIVEKKESWRFAWKDLIFTPDNVIDPDEKKNALSKEDSTITEFSGNGDSSNGNIDNGNTIIDEKGTLEDNIIWEDINNKNNNNEQEKIMLLLKNFWLNKNDIKSILDNYELLRINEVIDQCLSKPKDNPIWFIKDALRNNYSFSQNSSVTQRYESKKIIDEQEEQKKIAQAMKTEFNKKMVDDWIVNNNEKYKELILKEEKEYKQKNANNTFQPKNISVPVKINVRAYIQKEILDI